MNTDNRELAPFEYNKLVHTAFTYMVDAINYLADDYINKGYIAPKERENFLASMPIMELPEDVGISLGVVFSRLAQARNGERKYFKDEADTDFKLFKSACAKYENEILERVG